MTHKKVFIYRPGTKIKLNSEIDAVVIQVCIAQNRHITYLVSSLGYLIGSLVGLWIYHRRNR